MTSSTDSTAGPGRRWDLAVVLGLAGLAVALLWPVLRPGRLVVPDMDDAYFSVWRLAWVAHQLVRHPAALFDGNIFYPATGTLASRRAAVAVRSIHHWRRLVNGYNGFAPREYVRFLAAMTNFPDEESLTRLRILSVDYVVVRRATFAAGDAFARQTRALVSSPAFGAPQICGGGRDQVAIFPRRP